LRHPRNRHLSQQDAKRHLSLLLWHGNFYAPRASAMRPTAAHPDRWGSGVSFPDALQQQMTYVRTDAGTTAEGVRMFALPVKEFDVLHGKKHAWKDVPLGARTIAGKISGELFDIRATLAVGAANAVVSWSGASRWSTTRRSRR